MTRRRITHELVENENKRNTIFEERLTTLKKKAEKLSVLCDVEIGMVVHKRGGQDNALIWPSEDKFQEIFQKFQNLSSREREKKMVTHEKFLEQLLKSETEEVEKIKMAVEEKEALQLMAMAAAGDVEGGKPLDQMNLNELQAVSGFVRRMLVRMYKKKEENNVTGTSATAEGGQQALAIGSGGSCSRRNM